MITWIQKTFHEHFRFVFIALLVVSAVAFIFVNNASVGLGLFQSHAEKRPFFGINLADNGALDHIQKDAIISVFFQFGSIPPKNERLQQLSFKRHALVYVADQLHLPRPSSAEIEDRIKALRYFKDDRGRFDTSKYGYFQASPKSNTGLNMTFADFQRVIEDDLRIDQLQKLISGPGYVLPREVRQVLKQTETTWTLISANIDFKNALKPINTGESQIAHYFEENRSKYNTAPQVRVDYIEFPSSQFLNSVKVTENEVRAYYDANPTRFPKALIAANTRRSHDQDYELVRSNAEALLRQQRAQALATTAANDLVTTLDKNRILPGTPVFNNLLDKNHVSIKPLPAFSKDAPPAQFGRHSDAIAREGFNLGSDARYSSPVAISQGVVILVWQESIPERPAEFSEVAEKIKADYLNEERLKQIQAMGKRMQQRAEIDLKAGIPFQIAITKAAVNEGAEVTTNNHAPFTLRQHDTSQGGSESLPVDQNLMETLHDLDQGQMSNMVINGNMGKFIYVRNVQYSDLTEANPEYGRIAGNIATLRANATFDIYVANLVDSELKKSSQKQ